MPVETERLILWLGVGKSEGDSQSAEQSRKSLMLITPGDQGGLKMSLPNSWQPRRPGLKGGGVWSDGALQDGRTLLGDNVENVIETIVLESEDSNFQTLIQRITGLQRFINEARQFTSTFYQIEPCYIEWQALNGFGPQYALVYNIDIDVEYIYPGAGVGSATVTLQVEREPYWRGLPPGAHPRQWTFESRGLIQGKDWNYEDLNPFSTNISSLVEGTPTFRNEYLLSTDDYNFPSVSQSWLDIPAALIPGDAPALCMISMMKDSGAIGLSNTILSRITKPFELTAKDSGVVRGRPLTINATDSAISGSGTTKQTDTDRGMANASSGTVQVVRIVGASTGIITMPDTDIGRLSMNMMRGSYLIFVRGFAGGNYNTADIVSIRCQVRQYTGDVLDVTQSTFSTPISQNQVQTTFMGRVDLPLYGRSSPSIDAGLRNEDNVKQSGYSAVRKEVDIVLTVTVATATTYNIIDVLLIPFDEPCLYIKDASYSTTSGQIIDNTGYSDHGQLIQSAWDMLFENSTHYYRVKGEIQGQDLVLIPKKDNRIAIQIDAPGGADNYSRDSLPMKIDIIPRWIGVRDA